MGKAIFLYIVVMTILTIVYHRGTNSKLKLKDVRLSQINNLVQGTRAVKRLELNLRRKVKPSKRLAIEKKAERAGFKMSFLEFFMLSATSGLLMAMIFGWMLKSLPLSLMFFIMGLLVPNQVIGFIKNRRLSLLENQIGSFLKMTIARYKNTNDMNKTLRLVEKEFRGEEPIHSEITKTIRDIDVNVPVSDSLERMADRMDNKYMRIFASYYKITAEVGTEEAKEELLSQAQLQYEESVRLKRDLKKEIAGPKQEAYIMVGSIPLFAVYQTLTNDGYIEFMTKTSMGKAGTTGIIAVLIFTIWIINNKIGAPLD